MVRRPCPLLCIAGLCGVLVAADAAAQSPDDVAAEDIAAAEVLFREGQRLYAEGDVAAACPKFQASYDLDAGLGTLLNLARCYETQGKTGSAWARYLDLAALAARSGQNDRVAIAKERIAALEPGLVRLTLAIDDAQMPAGTRVERDGHEVPRALWNSAVVVDPGTHAIVVSAPGYETWSTSRAVGEEPGTTSRVEVPLLQQDETAAGPDASGPTIVPTPPVPTPAVEPGNASAEPKDTSEPTGDGSAAWYWAGGITAATGGIALAIGAGFTAAAASSWSDADCTDGVCPTPEQQALSEDASGQAGVATGFAIAGFATVAIGGALLLAGVLSQPNDEATIGAGPGGLELRF